MTTELSLSTKQYIQELISIEKAGGQMPPGERIHVDVLASKIAVLYEKIRAVVDYQEEHVLRKNAIERTLRRRFMMLDKEESFAELFVTELVAKGYFPNDQIPAQKVKEVEAILIKYVQAIVALNAAKDEKTVSWLFGVASCEVEEKLAPPLKEYALLEYAEKTLNERFVFKEERFILKKIGGEETNAIALFAAINKGILKTDRALTHWRVLKRMHPEWLDASGEYVSSLILSLADIRKNQEKIIDSLLTRRMRKLVRQYGAAFLLIHQAATKNPMEIESVINDESRFEPSFQEIYLTRFTALQKKVRRASFRSVISIFASKMAVAMGVEVPFDFYILHQFIPQALAFNVLFPPLLMFLIVSRIHAPSGKNFSLLLLQIVSLLKTRDPQKPATQIFIPRRKALMPIIYFFYAITFLISFGAIWYGLTLVGFSILSIIVFIMFLSLISFSALRIKEWTSELAVGEEKEGWGSFFLDLVALPIIKVGKWLSGELQRFNIFVVFLNILFEAPLQSIIAFVGEWRSFVKEKKEELQ